MEFNPTSTVLTLLLIQSWCVPQSLSFNVGTAGAKVFSGPATEEFGYTVHQFKNHLGKWLLVGSPWSGYKQDRKGDLYKCEITGSTSNCQRLNLQNLVTISTVKNINVNMSLGLTLTHTATEDKFITCGPLWAQKCGSQYYYPGICAEVSPLFKPLPAFSPALQTCGGPMDVAIVLDGSNSIYPWPPVVDFLKKLLENLDIGPDNTQVTIIQYGVDPFIEFHLNAHKTKQSMITAAAKIPQRQGLETNTFRAIEFARKQAFLPENGARPGASKVMVVVTDGESHDKNLRDDVIRKCETDRITRFGIAVLGYYIRNDIDTKNLVDEIKSIASTPTDRYFFNVSAEEALLEIAGSLGDRIFNIEGTGKGDGDFQMEMSQVGFSAHQTKKQNMIMLGAVGAYSWSGTVVHYTSQKSDIFPQTAFQTILQDKNHSSLLGYSVTTLNDGTMEYYVAGAPRSNHTGQVIVYTINAKGQPIVLDSQRGDQVRGHPIVLDSQRGDQVRGQPIVLDSQRGDQVRGHPIVLDSQRGDQVRGQPIVLDSQREDQVRGQPIVLDSQRGDQVRGQPIVLDSQRGDQVRGQPIILDSQRGDQVRGHPIVLDSQRGDQIGSYYGSVLCPLDVDKDGVSDLLLVGAPMFMSEHKKENGKVYLLTFTKGILSDQGVLKGPSPAENARFGMSISAVLDLNMDGYSDVVVGAPLEDDNRGVIYVFNGDKKTLRTEYSQRILGSKLDPLLQYFGRSLDTSSDLNDDTIPDVSVGAYGKVVQLWSRGVAIVTASVTFNPDKISILSKKCVVNGKRTSCFNTEVCFSATFKPKNPVGPVALRYNLTLDADLQGSRFTSRGQFKNSERSIQADIKVSPMGFCDTLEVFVQEAPDLVNSIGLRVEIALQDPDSSPVLDVLSPNAWQFFIPFSKECGSDEVCDSDLELSVKKGQMIPSSSKMLISLKNKRLSFTVSVVNKKENAYNTRVIVKYSKNLFYASITPPSESNEEKVECTSTQESYAVLCRVGYPVIGPNQKVSFEINFDFNLLERQPIADVRFEVLSDSTEADMSDNHVLLSIPVHYDSEITVSWKMDPEFYVIEANHEVKTTVNTFDDIGPEFKFSLKVSTGNLPISLAYFTVSMPSTTSRGNPLLYITGVTTAPAGDVTCDVTLNPLKITQQPYTPTFSNENLMSTEILDCNTAKCQHMKCFLKDMQIKSAFFVNVTSRIWNGTFAASTFQSTTLTVSTEIKTSEPELLIISNKHLTFGVTISKPGEKGEVPVGIIVGSVIGGLLLLALAIGLLWKLGFFNRKYQQLMKNPEEEEGPETQGLQENAAA
ncbi:integrin alpha-2 isoform X2 [Esox lucius]|uniref:integrin alpha-2 isoform X2 n=1 Tax=Esox lucius TaxID=8010 RepID=UPI0014777846|nr:integrin alpha-2 isoform X2 [Esox lucius]